MRPGPRISIRVMLLVVLACGIAAWIGRGWLRPRRLVGQRFALIGAIDIDRDGTDDRDRLKDLIRGEGGLIDYDLPPVGVATGKIGPITAYYVTDERFSRAVASARYLATKKAAINEARINAVRPLPIGRLLSRIGAN